MAYNATTQVADLLADMLAIPAASRSSGMVVTVNGRTAPFDGFEGTFVWQPDSFAPADDAILIRAADLPDRSISTTRRVNVGTGPDNAYSEYTFTENHGWLAGQAFEVTGHPQPLANGRFVASVIKSNTRVQDPAIFTPIYGSHPGTGGKARPPGRWVRQNTEAGYDPAWWGATGTAYAEDLYSSPQVLASDDQPGLQAALDAGARDGRPVRLNARAYHILGADLTIPIGGELIAGTSRIGIVSDYNTIFPRIMIDPAWSIRLHGGVVRNPNIVRRGWTKGAGNLADLKTELSRRKGIAIIGNKDVRRYITAISSGSANGGTGEWAYNRTRVTLNTAHGLTAKATGNGKLKGVDTRSAHFINVVGGERFGRPELTGRHYAHVINSTTLELLDVPYQSHFAGYTGTNPEGLMLFTNGENVNDATVDGATIIGFDTAFFASGLSRGKLANIFGDNTNGIYWAGSFDVSKMEDITFNNAMLSWGSDFETHPTIVAVTNNGAGKVRVSTGAVPHPFAVGDLCVLSDIPPVGSPAVQSYLYGRWKVIATPTATTFDLDLTYAGALGSREGDDPAATYNVAHRMGVGFRLYGWDGGMLNACFAFGYQNAWYLGDENMALSVNKGSFDANADYPDPTFVGLKLEGSWTNIHWGASFFSSYALPLWMRGTQVYIDTDNSFRFTREDEESRELYLSNTKANGTNFAFFIKSGRLFATNGAWRGANFSKSHTKARGYVAPGGVASLYMLNYDLNDHPTLGMDIAGPWADVSPNPDPSMITWVGDTSVGAGVNLLKGGKEVRLQAPKVSVIGVPVYTNNTTAKAALGTGALFHTGDGSLRVTY
ncbi:hypothetical protein [Roseomonas sp. 18066]|uniref:hypothetical protein n=1 Tax=Roseomonas sp. 18066 TaxID=2681412 RepID=UPI00135AA4F9|nr:hypothetical protein [Roseomonas sp. 18066]